MVIRVLYVAIPNQSFLNLLALDVIFVVFIDIRITITIN